MSFAKSEYDGWLDKYFYLSDEHKTVVELGCGFGDDTTFLLKTGHRIISCDLSEESLAELKRRYPHAETKHLNLMNPFPFEDDSADMVIASLCLHYFSDEEVRKPLAEIRRILKPDGFFLCRLNSENDRILGNADEQDLGSGMYMTKDGLKRFYSEDLVREVFTDFRLISLIKYETTKYSRLKSLWEFVALP